MANEPIYEVATFDFKDKICSGQTAVEARLLPQAGVSVVKILAFEAKGYADVTDVFTGEARVSGRVEFKALFIDGEGNNRVAEATTEFTDKISDDAIVGGSPCIEARVLATDLVKAEQNEIRLAAVVEMDLYDNNASRIKYVLSGGENAYVREERISGAVLAARVRENFELNEESETDFTRLLYCSPRVITSERTGGDDSITVGGEIICDVMGETDGGIASDRIVTPFSFECAAEGSRRGSIVCGGARLKNYTASYVESERGGIIVINYVLEICAFVYNEAEINAVADAFSIGNELSITYSSIPVSRNCACGTVYERAEGTVSPGNGSAERVIAVTAQSLTIANAFGRDGRLVIEGEAAVTVIYRSAETNGETSVNVELPFSITTGESFEGKIISAYGEITEVGVKLRRGSELDVKAEFAVNYTAVCTDDARLITELSVGEPIALPETAISLHIARPGESLWSLAKSLKTTPELVLLQNPELKLPPVGGERVVVYRHLKR